MRTDINRTFFRSMQQMTEPAFTYHVHADRNADAQTHLKQINLIIGLSY